MRAKWLSWPTTVKSAYAAAKAIATPAVSTCWSPTTMPSSGPGTRNWPRRFGMCSWPEPGNAARRRVSPLRARHQSDLSKLLFLRRESVLPLAGLVAYLWVGWLIHQEGKLAKQVTGKRDQLNYITS